MKPKKLSQVISFSEDYHEYGSQQELKDLINSMLDDLGQYAEGSTHGGLSPSNIQDILALLLYQENNQSIEVKISKDIDEYHLYLEILKKSK
ncbi:MAG: hypothetical protein ACR2ON_01060 [Paracoccaceae bacterium]